MRPGNDNVNTEPRAGWVVLSMQPPTEVLLARERKMKAQEALRISELEISVCKWQRRLMEMERRLESCEANEVRFVHLGRTRAPRRSPRPRTASHACTYLLVPQERFQELELSLNDHATPGMSTPFPTGFAAWPDDATAPSLAFGGARPAFEAAPRAAPSVHELMHGGLLGDLMHHQSGVAAAAANASAAAAAAARMTPAPSVDMASEEVARVAAECLRSSGSCCSSPAYYQTLHQAPPPRGAPPPWLYDDAQPQSGHVHQLHIGTAPGRVPSSALPLPPAQASRPERKSRPAASPPRMTGEVPALNVDEDAPSWRPAGYCGAAGAGHGAAGGGGCAGYCGPAFGQGGFSPPPQTAPHRSPQAWSSPPHGSSPPRPVADGGCASSSSPLGAAAAPLLPASPEWPAERAVSARGRRRRHATMVTTAEFREITAARAEQRGLAPLPLSTSAAARRADEAGRRDARAALRSHSVMLSDVELDQLDQLRAQADPAGSGAGADGIGRRGDGDGDGADGDGADPSKAHHFSAVHHLYHQSSNRASVAWESGLRSSQGRDRTASSASLGRDRAASSASLRSSQGRLSQASR